MRGIVAWTVVGLTLLSLGWTTVKSRRLMRRFLGRKLKTGEETSLKSWMDVPDAGLEIATRELERDPFERLVRRFQKMGMWKDDFGDPPRG